ncbi:MAG: hypothetical protein HY762_03610 [Planctomycetes bacterium]|nr:hypothetical protein [Planctomycetota bacterium]
MFFPRGGDEDNTTIIRAVVIPTTVTGQFRFDLFAVSSEPGYCLNAPQTLPTSGEDSAIWKDLQFPDQTDFTISGSDRNVALTSGTNNYQATVTVKSYDYGAYGKINAQFMVSGKTFIAKEEGNGKLYTNIQRDDDDNFIRDGSPQNSGPTGDNQLDDNDNMPAGSGTNGDGISRYEEWRGFMVQGVHRRLNVTKKDVFIRNFNVPDAGISGWFTNTAFNNEVDVYAILGTEWKHHQGDTPEKRVVNFNYSPATHGDNQQAIRVAVPTRRDPMQDPTAWGESLASVEPWVPNRQQLCKVNIRLITELLRNGKKTTRRVSF